MKGIYEMSLQLTLPLTTNATSSPASEPGATPCGGQGGPMTDQSGQEVVHASLSARQAKEAGLMTSGTYGPHGQNSLTPADHLLSLESKYPPPKSSAEQKRAKDRAYQLKYRKLHRAKDLIRHAKRRAEQKGVPFDLDDYENEIQARINLGTCELTGFRFNLDCGRTWDSPSLDRINPTEGYVFSNIRVVCHAVNSAMGDWGENTLIAMAMAIMDKRRQRSNDLSRALMERLRESTNILGSTLFNLTWKEWVTSSGHVIYRLRASAPRTSGSGCTSWPTPNAMDGGQTSRGGDRKGELLMGGLVQPASWPTPQGADGTRGSKTMQRRGTNYTMKGAALQVDSGETPRATEIVTGQNAQGGLGLTSTAQMTTWATPSARDWRDGRASEETMNRNSRPLNEQAVQLADSGETPNGSPAGMERPGQLNPALPRWLMGYPEIFDHCSPGWKEWAIAQRKLEECSGDPEALWLWLARIALEDCGDTATGL